MLSAKKILVQSEQLPFSRGLMRNITEAAQCRGLCQLLNNAPPGRGEKDGGEKGAMKEARMEGI